MDAEPTSFGQPSRGRKLSSWKEIAAYLGVTVRSVQRWEKTGGLPVRRLGRGRSARVVAFSGELDAWVRAGGASAARSLSNATQGRRPWWRRWRPLGAVAAVGLAILALALRILAAPGEPESWTWSGDGVLTVRDARSRTLWRKQFPGRQDKPAFATQPPVLIADIDGDGRREVLVQRLPSEPSRTPSSLFCFERTGRERWEFRYNARKTFGGRSFEPEFQPQLVLPVRIAGRGYLVTVANHRIWYPSQVALLDVHTGRLIEDYWHPGLIRHCLLRDLDGDGREELIFAGINNPGEGFGHAALGVLKLPFSQARRSPSRADDRFPPPTGGGEYRYVLCPTPDVNRVAGIWPIPTELSVDHLGRIRLALPLPESGAVVYYFDDTLSVVEARFSDNFAALHERYHRQRLLDHSLSARELAELQRVVSFPAAPDGNHPELRRFWQY